MNIVKFVISSALLKEKSVFLSTAKWRVLIFIVWECEKCLPVCCKDRESITC